MRRDASYSYPSDMTSSFEQETVLPFQAGRTFSINFNRSIA